MPRASISNGTLLIRPAKELLICILTPVHSHLALALYGNGPFSKSATDRRRTCAQGSTRQLMYHTLGIKGTGKWISRFAIEVGSVPVRVVTLSVM
ncbi:hypothetical protein EDD36DRAFT_260484 [Exophiala viscosa]|uniref:Uncharacterized protein n=1 Tax=Exophiala viscosa TaxID=2486360 RepID=A0AAN6ICX5_9EURO|nr:hypothetical protein EDD36DRAFT_260484 [Exophiala viscosa]